MKSCKPHEKQNKKHQNARSVGEKLKSKSLMLLLFSFFSCDLQDFKFWYVNRKAFGASFFSWVYFTQALPSSLKSVLILFIETWFYNFYSGISYHTLYWNCANVSMGRLSLLLDPQTIAYSMVLQKATSIYYEIIHRATSYVMENISVNKIQSFFACWFLA